MPRRTELIAGAIVTLFACSSSAPAPKQPAVAAPVAADAAVDSPTPDARDPLADAPAWVFRYTTAQRKETWTLRFAEGAAALVVESATGTLRYGGTEHDGKIEVSTANAKLALDCKQAQRKLSAKCNDTKAKPVDVLDCYHPDFKEPMPFGLAPGVEYAAQADCKGYRLIKP